MLWARELSAGVQGALSQRLRQWRYYHGHNGRREPLLRPRLPVLGGKPCQHRRPSRLHTVQRQHVLRCHSLGMRGLPSQLRCSCSEHLGVCLRLQHGVFGGPMCSLCRWKVQISTGVGSLHRLRSRQVLGHSGSRIERDLLGLRCRQVFACRGCNGRRDLFGLSIWQVLWRSGSRIERDLLGLRCRQVFVSGGADGGEHVLDVPGKLRRPCCQQCRCRLSLQRRLHRPGRWHLYCVPRGRDVCVGSLFYR